jgi:phospholipid/cholesterol/gamma-HCH transport system ATP-binding protein
LIIVVKNIKKSFDGQPVLRGVNLQIEEGKVTAIIGGSGCGKSVLLKHMIGLIKPDEGEVLIRGKNIARMSKAELNEIRKKMGMVFQGSAMFDSLTIGENVSMALRRFSNFSEAEIRERTQKALSLVQLQGIEDKYPSELSGGMKKRAAIARAFSSSALMVRSRATERSSSSWS